MAVWAENCLQFVVIAKVSHERIVVAIARNKHGSIKAWEINHCLEHQVGINVSLDITRRSRNSGFEVEAIAALGKVPIKRLVLGHEADKVASLCDTVLSLQVGNEFVAM